MAEGYVPQSTDTIRKTKEGYISLKRFSVEDLLHNRTSWEASGIRKGMLPRHVSDPYTGVVGEPYMTMNGVIVNPTSPEVISSMQFLITFPGSALLEALGVIEDVFEKYIDDEEGTKKSDNGPFGVLTRLQRAEITLQNLLFIARNKITERINTATKSMVTNRDEAVKWMQKLQLSIGMAERAQPLLYQSSDHSVASAIIDSMWDQLPEAKFDHIAEKQQLAEILRNHRNDRDQGIPLNLDILISLILNVFKPPETTDAPSDITLQEAMMAAHPTKMYQPPPEVPVRLTTGGAQGFGKRKTEAAYTLPKTDTERILGALYDLKSELGYIRKLVQNSDASKHADAPILKKGWRANEQDGKSDPKKPRSANFASKGKELTSLVTRVTRIDDSSDSDREASIAIVTKQQSPAVFNYRILSAMNNTTELGHLCKEPAFRSGQMCYGKELGIQLSLGTSKFGSMRIAEPIQNLEPMQSEMTSNMLSRSLDIETLVSMSSIGGQQMVASATDDERIKDFMEVTTSGDSKTSESTVTPIRSKEEQKRIDQEYDCRLCPPPPNDPGTWSATSGTQMPTPSMSSRSPICNFSPSAPQVENIVINTVSIPGPCYTRHVENAKEIKEIAELLTRPRTRSIARNEGFVIPDSLDISDSEDENGHAPQIVTTSTKTRALRSSAASKLNTGYKNRREPLSSLNIKLPSDRKQGRDVRFQAKNIEPTSSSACMSPSEMRTISSGNHSSTLPTGGGTGMDEDSDPFADLPDLVSSSCDSSRDGPM